MVCTECNGKLYIINSRHQKRSNQVWRRRRCLDCGKTFTTHEAIDLSATLNVESQNAVEPFMPDRLYSDILSTLRDRDDAYLAAREMVNTITKRLLELPSRPNIVSQEITRETAEVLKKFDKRAYLRYLAEHPWLG